MDVLYRDARRATWIGFSLNALLGAVKLGGGMVAGSVALISDAINSIGDVFTSIVVLFALRIAERPPDSEHPYGHTKAEAIAASNVALLIIVSALLVGREAILRIADQHAIPPAWTLWIAGGNVVIKELLYRYKIRIGKRTHSSALIANAWDHRSDALCAAAVLVGLSTVRVGGARFAWADDVAALIVATAIIAAGVALFRNSAEELMDTQAEPALVEQVRVAAIAVAGVEDVEKLHIRKSGLEYLADIHIEVAPSMTVLDGHRIGHDVQARLMEHFTQLRSVLVHLEPHGAPWRRQADKRTPEAQNPAPQLPSALDSPPAAGRAPQSSR
ncbi:MAG: cation transporter [Candidatus Schekmanbacteria bacterium]|nr:cation transporter [Candidatus Schekmanbacteria bacterium]